MEEKITIVIPDRAVGYIRVSTPDQAEDDKVSPEQQRQSIKAYIEKQGWEFVRFYEDLGISGSTMDDRQDLKDLLADAMKEKFDKVVVDKIDRFGRNNADFLNNKKILEAVAVNWVSVKEYFDETYVGHFSAGIMGQVAELEKDRITERLIGGRRKNLKDNGHGVVGRLPFARYYERIKEGKYMGRRDYDAGVKLDEKKAGIIRKVAEKYLDGEPLITISKEVGIKYHTLLRVLRDQCGSKWIINFNANKKFKDMQEAMTVTLDIPPILDDITIKKVRDMIEHNRSYECWKKVDKYPLSGFLKCFNCERSLTGQTMWGGRYIYYKHPVLTNKQKFEDQKPCNTFTYIKTKGIEDAVLRTVFQHIKDEDRFRKAIKDAFPEDRQEEYLDMVIEGKEKELGKVNKEIDNLADAVAKGVNIEIVKGKQDKLIANKAQMEEGLRELMEKRHTFRMDKEAKKEIGKLRRGLLKRFDSEKKMRGMAYDEKKKLFHLLFPGGEDPSGKAYGIYLRKLGKGIFEYTVNALLFLEGDYLYPKPISKIHNT